MICVLLGLFYGGMIALTYSMCMRHDIFIVHHATFSDDSTGSIFASILWPIGFWLVLGRWAAKRG